MATLADVIPIVWDMGADSSPPWAKRGGYAVDVAAVKSVCSRLRNDEDILQHEALRPRGRHGRTLLGFAVHRADAARVTHILSLPCCRSDCFNINAPTNNPTLTLLFLACQSGQPETARLLVAAGAKLENTHSWRFVRGKARRQSLVAVAAKHVPMMQALVEEYHFVPTDDDLALVASYGTPESITFLLRARQWDEAALRAAWSVAALADSVGIVSVFQATGVEPPLPPTAEEMRLVALERSLAAERALAAQRGAERVLAVEIAVAAERELDTQPVKDTTPLNFPSDYFMGGEVLRICTSSAAAFKVAADAGLNVKLRRDDGSTLLHVLCGGENDCATAVWMFLNAGGDADVVDKAGAPPLYYACRRGHVATA